MGKRPRMLRWGWWEAGLALALLAQLAFWGQTHTLRPALEVVPPPPTLREVQVMALGDDQAYFRILALSLQNFGDTFGRFTPLKQYNYEYLARWCYRLDELDARSNLIPSLVAYYFSQTQRPEEVRHLIPYLRDHARRDPARKWWWLGQAAYLAGHSVKDQRLALALAEELAAIPGDLPIWTRQLPAFIHEGLGEKQQAYEIMKGILDSAEREKLSPGEFAFMRYFLDERLGMDERGE